MRPIVFIDLETGGLDPETCAVLELGAYTEIEGRVRTFQALVREPGLEMGKNIHDEALKINGLTLTRVRVEGRNVSDVALEFGYFLRDVHLEAHCTDERILLGGQNVQFDTGFLNRLWRLAGVAKKPNLDYRCVDLASIGEALMRAGKLPAAVTSKTGAVLKMPGLDAAAEFFGIERSGPDGMGAHRALGDAKTAHLVYQQYENMLRGVSA